MTFIRSGGTDGGLTEAIAGEDISNRDVCYISTGALGTTAGSVYLADASSIHTSTHTAALGISQAAVTQGNTVTLRTLGVQSGLDQATWFSTTWDIGDILYVGSGSLTEIRPARAAAMGVAISSTEILIRPTSSGSSLLNQKTAASSSSGGQTTGPCATWQLPANTLTQAGQSIRIVAFGRTVAGNNPIYALLRINGVGLAERRVSSQDSYFFDAYVTYRTQTTGVSVGLASNHAFNGPTAEADPRTKLWDPVTAAGSDPDTTLAGVDFAANMDIEVYYTSQSGTVGAGLFRCDQLLVWSIY